MYNLARLAHRVTSSKIQRVVPTWWQHLFVLLFFWAIRLSITRETGNPISLKNECNVSLNYDCDFISYIIPNPLSLMYSWAYLFPQVDRVVWESRVSVKKTLLILLHRSIISLVYNCQDKMLSAWCLHSCELLSIALLASSSDASYILINWFLLTPFPRVTWTAPILSLTWATASGPRILQMWPYSSSSWPRIGSENNLQGISLLLMPPIDTTILDI